MDDRTRAAELAAAHEDRLVGTDERRARGAFYTPPELVEWVLSRALTSGTARVLDPACGTGNFLVAAARRLGDVRAVYGSDIDEQAVRIARLRLQAEDPSVPPRDIANRVVVANGLTAWQGEKFDAVVGNPPFLGQLKRRTAGHGGAVLSASVGPYTDTSAAFLHRALDLVVPGGTVALVQPLSILAARDAGPVREAVVEVGAVRDLWVSDRPVFRGTGVRACVPLVRIGAQGGPDPHSWGPLAARQLGIPSVDLPQTSGVLGDLAVCTADFRDQYYGLVPFVREAEGGERGLRFGTKPQSPGPNGCGLAPNRSTVAPLITSGLLEPGRCDWGRRPTRFARQTYAAPVVDVEAVRRSPLGAWVDARLVPKVMVAGQGRVIEAAVDERGGAVPSVPVLSVIPSDPAHLWRLLAVLVAPPVVVDAAARYLGTGLSIGSVKVSARQLARLPLPVHERPWTDGAELLRAGRVAEAAAVMTSAYGIEVAEVLDWWRGRAMKSGRER